MAWISSFIRDRRYHRFNLISSFVLNEACSVKVTITNDGATIIDLLDIVHPAAKVLADIAKSQDNEVLDLILFAF